MKQAIALITVHIKTPAQEKWCVLRFQSRGTFMVWYYNNISVFKNKLNKIPRRHRPIVRVTESDAHIGEHDYVREAADTFARIVSLNDRVRIAEHDEQEERDEHDERTPPSPSFPISSITQSLGWFNAVEHPAARHHFINTCIAHAPSVGHDDYRWGIIL